MECLLCEYASQDETKFFHLKPWPKKHLCKNCCFDIAQVVRNDLLLRIKKP